MTRRGHFDVPGQHCPDQLRGAGEIFGEPIFPDNAEHQDVRIVRDELAGPGDQTGRHLGEAETLAIIVRRQLRCFFVTDDRDAARRATKNHVQVVRTWDLLRVAHRKRWVDDDTLWGYMQTLARQGRGAPRGVRDRLSFDKWLAS